MSLYDSLSEGPGFNVAFNDLPALAWARANGMGDHVLALVHLAWQSNAAVESTATVRGGLVDCERRGTYRRRLALRLPPR